MPKCIWCGKEFPDDATVKQHIAEDHIGIHFTEGAKPSDIQASAETTDSQTKPQIEKTQLTEKKQNDTPKLPLEKPKKRYLAAEEIITLLQNTHATFPRKELLPCPVTKEAS